MYFLKLCELSARIHVGEVGTCEGTDCNLSSTLSSGQVGFNFGRAASETRAVGPGAGELVLARLLWSVKRGQQLPSLSQH